MGVCLALSRTRGPTGEAKLFGPREISTLTSVVENPFQGGPLDSTDSEDPSPMEFPPASQDSQGDMLSMAKSPINIQNLNKGLDGYDRDKATLLINGFSSGFPLHYSGKRVRHD